MNKKIVRILTTKRYGDWLENLIKLMGGLVCFIHFATKYMM